MPFPYVAVASAGLGIAQSLFGASSAEKARKAENKAAKASYKLQQGAALASMRAQNQMDELNYVWKLAQNAALDFQERQAEADYNWRAGRLTEAALTNLRINEGAIFDQYVTAENLRATQDQMSLAFEQGQLGLQANRAAAGYMTAIRDNALQAEATALSQNKQVTTLIQNQVMDQQMDGLKRDIQFVAAMADRGQAKARGLGRGLSATTTKSLEMNTAKALGRSYGELALKQRERQNSLATLNATMQGEVAKGLGRLALASQQQMRELEFSNQDYNARSQLALETFSKLTMPGYKLAANQGQRELDALFLQTQGRLDEASMPFRKDIRFEPQKALPQMYPVMQGPTYRQGQSTGGVIANAVVAGAKGALSGTFTKQDGSLGWF